KTNASFPALLKTAFRLLNMPPLNLFDATASDLSDCFTDKPDFTPYTLQAIRPELFDPAKARDPLDPKPGAKMDDPKMLREQHQFAAFLLFRSTGRIREVDHCLSMKAWGYQDNLCAQPEALPGRLRRQTERNSQNPEAQQQSEPERGRCAQDEEGACQEERHG